MGKSKQNKGKQQAQMQAQSKHKAKPEEEEEEEDEEEEDEEDVDFDDDEMDDDFELFWHLVVNPNEEVMLEEPENPSSIICITHACFGEQVNKDSRTILYCATPGLEQPVPVCILNSGANESQPLNLKFGSAASFSIKGRNPSTIYLSGYVQPPELPMINDLDAMEGMSEEEDDMGLEEKLRARLKSRKHQALEDDDEEDSQGPIPKKRKMDAQSKPTSENKPLNKKQLKKQNKSQQEDKKPNENEDKKTEAKEETTTTTTDSKEDQAESKKLPSGIEIKDIKVGTGAVVQNGQTLNVFYVGQLENKKVFDKTLTGKGFEFKLGSPGVIQGWNLGIKGMKIGGKRRIVIPPKYAYGEEGTEDGTIPENATLTFTIEVRSAK